MRVAHAQPRLLHSGRMREKLKGQAVFAVNNNIKMSDYRNRVADALNSLTESNIRGHVYESELRTLINDYFGGIDDVESYSEAEDSSVSDTESIPASDDVVGSASSVDEYDDLPDDDLVTTDEVASVLGTSAHKIPDAMCESDDEELERIKNFSCRCRHYNNGPCYRQFTAELVLNRRTEMKSFTEGI